MMEKTYLPTSSTAEPLLAKAPGLALNHSESSYEGFPSSQSPDPTSVVMRFMRFSVIGGSPAEATVEWVGDADGRRFEGTLYENDPCLILVPGKLGDVPVLPGNIVTMDRYGVVRVSRGVP